MNPINLYLTDDDVDDKELFLDALTEIPVEAKVKQFENGVELMADLFSDRPLPDAVYLDLHMPMMNGFECLDEIRSIPEFSGIQVIMYSTSNNEKEIEELEAVGADQYICKPSSFNQLKTLIYKSLNIVAQSKKEKKNESKFKILI